MEHDDSIADIANKHSYTINWQMGFILRASCHTLEICYEAKIEESEKAGSRRELNPEHLWLEPPVLCQ